MQVTAAVVASRGADFELRGLALAEPGSGQVLVRIMAVGICHTDLTLRDHDFGIPLPIVLGHEGAGLVEALGDGVTGLAVGDTVVLSYGSCGTCHACADDAPQYCAVWGALNSSGHLSDGRVPFSDGGAPVYGAFFNQSSFATYALAGVRNTVKVTPGTPWEILAPLGCGMMTGAGTVLNTLRPDVGQSLIVFGAGGVGMAAIMAARVAGCAPLVAVDLDEGRLTLALELGATHVFRGNDPALSEKLHTLFPFGADFTIDTSAAPNIVRVAIDLLATRGTCALIAVMAPGTDASFAPGGLINGKVVRGAVEGDADPQIFVPRLLAMHAAGDFPLGKLVATYPFANINEAVADMKFGRKIKPVLIMEHDKQSPSGH